MNNKRDLLISLSIKYQGQYPKIVKALQKGERTSIQSKEKCITILDKSYPEELLQLANPPLVLFYRGNIELLKERKIAIVGSRQACLYGQQCTLDIVNYLKDKYVIVSGLAKGIDGIAHQNATKTIAIIGNGLDIYYPRENTYLQKNLERNQLVISEYPQGTKPAKYHFPWRNRIIAALSESVIVTQAKKRSGTMITVNEALNLNKSIYSVVYPYNTVYGQGCNELIMQGANIITQDNLQFIFDK